MKVKRLGLCAVLLIGLQGAACSEEPETEIPDEPDRPSPTETLRTVDLRAQIEEVEDACVLLEAEMIKQQLLQEEYEGPSQSSPISACNTGVRRDCADSGASINLYIHPEDNNVEAAENFHDWLPEDLVIEGYIGQSSGTEAYAAVYDRGHAAVHGPGSYMTGVYILAEFYFIRAELEVPGGECMPALDELTSWLFEKYAPAVVEGIESRIDR